MRVYHVVLFVILAGTAVPVALHHHVHGTFNPHQIALAFFLWLNFIINLWEIGLYLRFDEIEAEYLRHKGPYKGRELVRIGEFFNSPISLGKVLSPSSWTEIWSSYALFDPGYANKQSFGYAIDVGNGFTTLLPGLFLLYGMTFELVSARTFGIVACLVLYQQWYGTLVYFGSFIVNKRYVGHTKGNLALFVGLSNGMWFTFPIWGIVLGISMIWSNSYALLR